ncbi:MAG: polyprenyl synthetase family protein [Pseudomonadota bacterium]
MPLPADDRNAQSHGRDDLQAALASCATAVERELETHLDDPGDTSKRLVQAMRHAALDGGKRVRPFLVIESARIFDQTGAVPLRVAAALECIHCYSLVHDDLPAMDDDKLRRGKPTVWAAYDEWTAILAGDALLTLAFDMVSDPALPLANAAKLNIIRSLSRASGWRGMVGGQAIDLEADKLDKPADPDEAHIRHLQSLKTGALLVFGATAGARIADADADALAALDAYGRAIGLAFQIADDLLDAEGDAATMGKAVGKDADAGKATLVGLLGRERARQELNAAHEQAISHLAPFGARADRLRALAGFIVSRKH